MEITSLQPEVTWFVNLFYHRSIAMNTRFPLFNVRAANKMSLKKMQLNAILNRDYFGSV